MKKGVGLEKKDTVIGWAQRYNVNPHVVKTINKLNFIEN